MDYSTKDRDEYLFTPTIEDTIENIDTAQEKVITIQYGTFNYKGKIFYHNKTPDKNGKIFIYDDNLLGRVRLPKPVGEIRLINGEMKKVFYIKKKKINK